MADGCEEGIVGCDRAEIHVEMCTIEDCGFNGGEALSKTDCWGDDERTGGGASFVGGSYGELEGWDEIVSCPLLLPR